MASPWYASASAPLSCAYHGDATDASIFRPRAAAFPASPAAASPEPFVSPDRRTAITTRPAPPVNSFPTFFVLSHRSYLQSNKSLPAQSRPFF